MQPDRGLSWTAAGCRRTSSRPSDRPRGAWRRRSSSVIVSPLPRGRRCAWRCIANAAEGRQPIHFAAGHGGRVVEGPVQDTGRRRDIRAGLGRLVADGHHQVPVLLEHRRQRLGGGHRPVDTHLRQGREVSGGRGWRRHPRWPARSGCRGPLAAPRPSGCVPSWRRRRRGRGSARRPWSGVQILELVLRQGRRRLPRYSSPDRRCAPDNGRQTPMRLASDRHYPVAISSTTSSKMR